MTSSRDNPRSGVAERIKLLTPKYGTSGSQIPGSRYVRWYCDFCGEPMRVSPKPWPTPVRDCERCAGRHGQVAVGTSSSHVDDGGGSQANAIRAMEGD
jgi:hypothetical protein